MAYDNNEKRVDSVYSQRVRAGKRRTYFFDVRETRGNDYYLTITESRKKFNEDGYERHKIFLYKEDFNKFLKGMTEAIDYVKTELMPDFDFDIFNHENDDNQPRINPPGETNSEAPTGIAEAATPELDTENETKEKEEPSADTTSSAPPSESPSSSPDEKDTPQQDEHVDKW